MHERSEPGGVRIVDHDRTALRDWHAPHLELVRVGGDEHDPVVRGMRTTRLGDAVHHLRVNMLPRIAGSADSGLCHSDHAARGLVSLPLRPQQSANPQSVWVRQPD